MLIYKITANDYQEIGGISKNYHVVDIRAFRRSSSSIDNSGARNKYENWSIFIETFIVLLQLRYSKERGCFVAI